MAWGSVCAAALGSMLQGDSQARIAQQQCDADTLLSVAALTGMAPPFLTPTPVRLQCKGCGAPAERHHCSYCLTPN